MKGVSFDFRSDATSSFLTIALDKGYELLEYQMNMISSNPTPTLLPLKLRREDGQPILFYDITSRQTLALIVERKKLTKKQFLTLLSSIVRTLKDAANLYLNEEGFLLDKERIYVNPSTMEPALVYLPVSNLESADVDDALSNLTEQLLTKVDVHESMGDNFIHRFLVLLDSNNFSLRELDSLLNEIDAGGQVDSPQQPAKAPTPPREPAARPAAPPPQRQEAAARPPVRRQPVAGESKPADSQEEMGFRNIPFVATMPAKKAQIFVLLQVLFVLLALIAMSSGMGVQGLLAVVLLAAGADFVLYRQWATGQPAPDEKEAKSSAAVRSAPAAVRHQPQAPKASARPVNMNKREVYNQPAKPQEQEASMDEGTMILSSPDLKRQPCLLLTSDGGMIEKFNIDKPSLLVGRSGDQVDILLKFNSISRIHAKITLSEEQAYVEDLNSRNGTYVNGERLASNVPKPINDGDKVSFADQILTYRSS